MHQLSTIFGFLAIYMLVSCEPTAEKYTIAILHCPVVNDLDSLAINGNMILHGEAEITEYV